MIPTVRNLFLVCTGLACAACIPARMAPDGGSGAAQPAATAAAPSGMDIPSGRTVTHQGFSIDPVNARACVECHKGGAAGDLPSPGNFCGSSGSHPAFMPYPPPGRNRGFHPPERIIAAGIRLPDGMVTCISCHDLEKETLHHLAVEDTGSQLCLTCHRI